MRTLRLTLQYDGTRYAGWQVQPGLATVQGKIEEALARILGGPVGIVGSGRTDAGVHARGQVASLRTESAFPAETLRRAANALLPWDIRVLEADEAPVGFDARARARSKEYRYQLWTGDIVPPFLYPFAGAAPFRLDAERFRAGAREILGRHDFSAFASTGSTASEPLRAVSLSELDIEGDLWVYRIAANGFLYKMVRSITGTLLEVARGRWEPERIAAILASRDRAEAGPALPAKGLFLQSVDY